MQSAEGAVVGFLAKVRPNAYPTVPRPPPPVSDVPSRTRSGTVDDLLHSVAGDATAARLRQHRRKLENRVKLCGQCGKPNAVTLSHCNACTSSLHCVPISATPNIFSAFVLGVERGARFPFTVSVRHESRSLLVFDDPLALSPVHFCAIPSTAHIPDWRYLLKRPSEGLRLIREMRAACDEAAQSQFFSNPTWCSALVRELTGSAPRFDVGRHMLCGFNFPPSQYQLHLQYLSPMLLPHHYALFLRRVHFTTGRFFPYSYVERCLESLHYALLRSGTSLEVGSEEPINLRDLLDRLGMRRDPRNDQWLTTGCSEKEDDDVPAMEGIVEAFRAAARIDYEREHSLFLRHVSDTATQFSNWTTKNFEGQCVPQESLEPKGSAWFISNGASAGGVAAPLLVNESTIINADKLALQNYGRPYDAHGQPTGVYYSYPRRLEEYETW